MNTAPADTTARLAHHIAQSPARPLPPEVMHKAALHLLDTIAAMVSGTQLAAGAKALAFATASASGSESLVIGTQLLVSAPLAAMANGMLAHADETDDSHARSLTHPGCAVIPAALALADREGATGLSLLRAIAVGYDVGPRVAEALGADRFLDTHHASHSYGGLFGAAAACGALLRLTDTQCAHLLAYAVQMASGNACWRRDADHVEKAFDFGGMPAHHGVLAALMVQAGFTGATRPLEGTPGLFAAFPATSNPDLATAALGERYELMHTAIKKWCVGSPIQAALDSLEHLMAVHGFGAAQVHRIVVDLPAQSVPIVDDRDMPDVSLQHQLALMLVDGTVTFHSGHDRLRMGDPHVSALRRRIAIQPRSDAAFLQNMRQAIVRVETTDGSTFTHHTPHVRGTPANPMTPGEIRAKAEDLMRPVLGAERTARLAERVLDMESLGDVRRLRPLLDVPQPPRTGDTA
jgi:2-methylcitrate dehydratase PrpD